MKRFNFRKTIKRNNFTKIFGGVGCRRVLLRGTAEKRTAIRKSLLLLTGFKWSTWRPALVGRKHRCKMQKVRRAHQGWRNITFGSIQAIKIRLRYGRRAPSIQFRR